MKIRINPDDVELNEFTDQEMDKFTFVFNKILKFFGAELIWDKDFPKAKCAITEDDSTIREVIDLE